MDQIAEVEIERDGVYKYILIRVSDKKASKLIVRGYSWADYHGQPSISHTEPALSMHHSIILGLQLLFVKCTVSQNKLYSLATLGDSWAS